MLCLICCLARALLYLNTKKTVLGKEQNMLILPRLKNLFFKELPDFTDPILSQAIQIKAWRNAIHRMGWSISENELAKVAALPSYAVTDEERRRGFVGTALFYGFGRDVSDRSDAVLSGKLAWEFSCRNRKERSWQCEYIDFDKPEDIRLRSDAPPRPKGFYFAKIQLGARFQKMTVNQLRRTLDDDTGLGPEGFQLLGITHPHLADWMNERKMPFIALADYDVAPYGFNDFFDAPQLFCSNRILGLGIGNVDRNYPLFGIPTLRFVFP
jgi:uncharacterized protein YndB with AHSA1/START domain